MAEDGGDYGGPRAFSIVGESSPADGPPATGEDYLRRVRWETKRIPGLVVADIDPRQYDHLQTTNVEVHPAAASPPELLPDIEWQKEFLAEFLALRQRLEEAAKKAKPSPPIRIPHFNDTAKWKAIVYGSSSSTAPDPSSSSTSQPTPPPSSSVSQLSGILPVLSLVLALDERSVNALISRQLHWASKGKRPLQRRALLWIWALLCRLQPPLDPDTCADLSDFLRRCRHERAKLAGVESELLPMLNILITIITRYFRQGEPEER